LPVASSTPTHESIFLFFSSPQRIEGPCTPAAFLTDHRQTPAGLPYVDAFPTRPKRIGSATTYDPEEATEYELPLIEVEAEASLALGLKQELVEKSRDEKTEHSSTGS